MFDKKKHLQTFIVNPASFKPKEAILAPPVLLRNTLFVLTDAI